MKNKKLTLQTKGVVFRVSFNVWNGKVIRCRLNVEHQNGILEGFYQYEGKAYCNLEEDVFDYGIGEEIAFERAMKKYIKDILSVSKVVDDEIKRYTDGHKALLDKFYEEE